MDTKIVCTQVYKTLDNHGFQEGQVYKVVKGKLIFPNGSKSHTTFNCIEQINESFYAVFKEVEEVHN